MPEFKRRTFGWVQNPGRLDNLKRVVGIFVKESNINKSLLEYRLPIIKANGLITDEDYKTMSQYANGAYSSIPYSVLKGRGNSGSRGEAKCSGLVQAVIDAQGRRSYIGLDGEILHINKLYTDDWSADGFLRWAVSTGLLAYDRATDCVSITKLGRELVSSENGSEEEKKAFTRALMSYPPVRRVLSILEEDISNEGLTKFEIGRKLGFIGEMGFTSIDQGYYLALLSEATSSDERSDVRSNVEGDSDKYARMIALWLKKMDWVESVTKMASGVYRGVVYQEEMTAYKISVKGDAALKAARGNSRHPSIPKIVMFEMLATKAQNAGYLRRRRANIIKCLAKPLRIEEIQKYLSINGLKEEQSTILDDIEGLRSIGLRIVQDGEQFSLLDSVCGLDIPSEVENKKEISILKDRVRSKLHYIDHSYLVLIDLAYSDSSTRSRKNADAREFEIQTANLLTKELNFCGCRLGDSNRPDVVVWKDSMGVIIDNKSYRDGFSIGRGCEDEMSRYVEQAQMHISGQPRNEWWRVFIDNSVKDLHYLFVTSFLKGAFRDNLRSLSVRRAVDGGAISVDNLLYLAERIRSGEMELEDFPTLLHNDEVIINL